MTHESSKPRRWRTVAVVGGSLAALAVGGVSMNQAFADPGTASQANAPQFPAPKKPDLPQPAQGEDQQTGKPTEGSDMVTGREVTAALYGAVTELVPGQGSEFTGQGGGFTGTSDADWLSIGGDFTLAPADGSAVGSVGVGIMHESMYGGGDQTCDPDQNNEIQSCQITELEDGSTLKTYGVDWGDGVKSLVAEHFVDGLRVSIEANNIVNVSGKHDEDVTVSGPDPVLSLEQLTEIVSKPWWSLEAPLDSPYEDTLPSYEEFKPVVVE